MVSSSKQNKKTQKNRKNKHFFLHFKLNERLAINITAGIDSFFGHDKYIFFKKF